LELFIFILLFSHIEIAKLKIEIYKNKNANENEDEPWTGTERKAENKVIELERKCLIIRSRELYFETMPQLVLQFASLSTTSLWEQGKDSSYYFYVNIKAPMDMF